MIFEAIYPLRLTTKTLGTVTLKPGERRNWPDEAVRLLLEKMPQKIRIIENPESFQIGRRIRYRIPIGEATSYEWEWHQGRIELIDERWNMALVIPETERELWRWVSMIYIKVSEKEG